MKVYCDVNGNKRVEDDDGNEVELDEKQMEIVNASNAGGEVDVREILDILKRYE